MPQAVTDTWTPDRMDEEFGHTDDTLEIEGLSEHALEPQVRPIIEELREKNRKHTRRRRRLESKRKHINRKLDKLVRKAGTRLDGHLERDHEHPDWRRHFPVPPSEFARQPFAEQVRLMKGWVQNPHPALADLHEAISKQCARADEVFIEETNLQHAQRQLEGERGQVATVLTGLRDELERVLGKIGENRGEDRDFAASFFL